MHPLDTGHGVKGHNGNRATGGTAEKPSGLQLLFCTRESSVLAVAKISRRQSCYGRLVHSGVIIAVLEEVMTRTARAFLQGVPRSVQMNFAFMKPLANTGTLRAKGKVIKIGKRGVATIEGVVTNDRKEVAARSTSEWEVEQPSDCDDSGQDLPPAPPPS